VFKKLSLLNGFLLCLDAAWCVIDLEFIFYCGGGVFEAIQDMDKAFKFTPTAESYDEYTVDELQRM
jgi:hypothetical protein